MEEIEKMENLDSKNQTTTKKKNVKLNYFYNLAYQIFLVIVPLVVTPYISRVLTPEGVGQYSFSFSIITYFTIIGALGFGTYAQREIAKHQGDKYSQTKSFWEINICRLLPVSIALIINITFCSIGLYGAYNQLMWIFNINIVAIAFDIAFLYQGNEEFGKLVLRNFIVKALSISAIFIFVKNTNDLWLYTLINALSVFLSNGLMWAICNKFLIKINFKELKPLSHLKGTLILFLPTIAVSIYTVLDKTLIGLLITDTYETTIEETVNGVTTTTTIIKQYSDLENGYYEQSEKLIKMAMTIITAIGTVMIPRNSSEFAKGNLEAVKKNINISSNLVLLIGLPLVLGFIVIAQNMVPWFFGDGYDKCTILIRILAPLIIIIGFSNVFGLQYLVPSGQDRKYTFAIIAGAAVNLVLNLVFIKLWWSIGAAIATIIAESVVTIIMACMVKNEVNFFKLILNGWKYYIAAAIMYGACFAVSYFLESSILNSVIIILTGIVTYFVPLIVMKEQNVVNALERIRPKIFKK